MSEAVSDSGLAILAPVVAPILVSDTSSFKAAIDRVDSASAGFYVIQLANNINENGTLDAINLQTGVTLTIDGAGYTLDGGNQYRGLFAYAGVITIQSLSINDMVAKGGKGGTAGGGGGAGLGGGLFVAGTNAGLSSGASVVLTNVTFSHDQAVGGLGNTGVYTGGMGGTVYDVGGGGGLGGSGAGLYFGGGGGIGADAGMAGIVPGTAGGGASAPLPGSGGTYAGGLNGGGGGEGGAGFYVAGGGGGIGGGNGTQGVPPRYGSNGGAGGFGGGGGGFSGGLGGNGGFGGGGGGGFQGGGNGGFGGGGSDSGVGGFGAGSGASEIFGNNPGAPASEGGGGLGAGGAVFVQFGGSLTIQGGTVSGGSAAGGAVQQVMGFPAVKAQPGLGLGSGLFVQGGTLNLSAAAGQTTTISDVIADQGQFPFNTNVNVSGAGTVVLAANNTYSGNTFINGPATLEVAALGAAGTSFRQTIYFAAPGGVLRLDPTAFVGGRIGPMVNDPQGDNFDFPGLPYSASASATFVPDPNQPTVDGTLTVTSAGSQDQLTILTRDPFLSYQAVADATGGTLVEEVGNPQVVNPTGTFTGSGLYLKLSEDAYLGDAQFTVAVDGVSEGGVQTVRALHNVADGTFVVQGDYASGPHTVTVTFINDAYGGSPALDRNLYIDSIGLLSNALPSGTPIIYGAGLDANGSLSFLANTTVPTGPVTIGAGPNSFTLNVSEDAYLGNADFQVTVDGVQVGPVQIATALHGSGQTQAFTVQGNFSVGPHIVGVAFLNDAYGGSPSTDRNLYVDSVQSGGQTYGGLVLDAGGTQYLTIPIQPPASVTLGSGPDTIELNVSEDAYASGGQTDAQFTISVDGKQIGGVQTADAARSQGKTEAFLVEGAFGPGPHAVTVNFVNDAYGGSLSLDRNLYVESIIAGGQSYGGITLQAGGPQTKTIQTPADMTIGSGPSALTLALSEDALAGVDAQVTLSLGGVQIGGVQTVTASHAAGADQLFTILGDFRLGQAENMIVTLLNGGGGRNLYIDKLTEVAAPGVTVTDSVGVPELTDSGGAYAGFYAGVPSPIPAAVGTGPNSVTVDVSIAPAGSSPPGYIPFIFLLDGVEIGGDQVVSAIHGPNSTQAFTFQGNFGPGPHTVFISPQTGSGQTGFFLDAITYEGVTTQLNTQVQETGLFIPIQPTPGFQSGSPLIGPAGGNALLNGTPNADTIIAQGGHNTINGLGGNDAVTGSTVGGDTINIGAAGDTKATQDTVVISGAGNTVMAVNASVSLTGSATNTVASLGEGNNTVQLDGVSNTVKVGLGTNTISMMGGNAQIAIGQESGSNYADTITLSGTGNQVAAAAFQGRGYLGAGNVTIKGGSGGGLFSGGPGTFTLNTDGPGNRIGVTGGMYDITAGSGSDSVSVSGAPPNFGSPGMIHLAGLSNVVSASQAYATILGGTGNGTFNLGLSGTSYTGTYPGTYTLTTGGTNNTVNVSASPSTIDPGSGGDTVSFKGYGNQSVIFRGSDDMLFLHSTPANGPSQGGVTATVNDQSSNLQVFIDPYLLSLTLTQFGTGGVLHLLNGAGGYTSAAAAAAAITSDTGGGTMLALPTFNAPGVNYSSGSIHFAAGEHITAANFSIG